MSDSLPILFVKEGCPWCIQAEGFLRHHKIPYRRIEVRHDPIAFQRMIDISGQTKAPTLLWIDDTVLADFDIQQLIPFLEKKGIKIPSH
ncbi:MAG: glutaredoxin family protein [Methylacidiphilales bacterium]|nr:glutaredoxin family protein [Candidatus Methylacidiphilales bacterium]MDW8349098.1 glutaredoxin family protein [Verrucomicrobiae bacterium]